MLLNFVLVTLGFFCASSQLSLSPWTAAGSFPLSLCVPKPPCERAQVALSNTLGCCGEMGFLKTLISAEPVVVIPHLLNSSPWKQLFLHFVLRHLTHFKAAEIWFANNLPLFLSQPLHFSIKHPPYQYPSQSIPFKGQPQPPNPLFIRKGWSKSALQLIPKALRLRCKMNCTIAFYE